MDQRRRVVKLIKTLQPQASNRQIAKTLGVSKDTVRRDTGANAPPPAKNPNENNHAKHTTGANAPPGLSGAEVVRLAQRQAAKTESADRAERRLGDYRSVERAATSKATIRRRSRASVRGLIT
jgi:transposase